MKRTVLLGGLLVLAAVALAAPGRIFDHIDNPDIPANFTSYSSEELNGYDQRGQTPLYYAVKQARTFCQKERTRGHYFYMFSGLLAAGADVNLGKKGSAVTPLMVAVYDNDCTYRNDGHSTMIEFVEALLQQEATDVNASNSARQTALMYALSAPNASTPQVVKLLRGKGADMNAKDNTGQTALDYLYLWLEKYSPGKGGYGTKEELLWGQIMQEMVSQRAGTQKADVN